MQVTTYAAPTTALATVEYGQIETIQIPNSRNFDELIQRIGEASATTHDVRVFLKKLGKQLDKRELRMVEYALARANYRENRTVSLREVSLLASQSIAQVTNHLLQLGISMKERFSADEATRVLCRAMD